MFEQTIKYASLVWLILDSGSFVENKFVLETNSLFWPMWIGWALFFLITIKFIESKK